MADKGALEQNRLPLIRIATRNAKPQGSRHAMSLSRATLSRAWAGHFGSAGIYFTFWLSGPETTSHDAVVPAAQGNIGRRFDGPDMWFQGPPQGFSPTTLRPASPWDRGRRAQESAWLSRSVFP
jgi:hypothetical protein